ncbi:MAG TPA: tetratricopeptide repeat protein [Gemmatimonadales bacterium]
MPSPFLSSEEYDERAHQLYNEGQYDEALVVLREGLALYPHSVELHVGVGYARLAREEYAWARRSFEEALVLDGEHEDALAGLGETLLKFGQREVALRTLDRLLELGYQDDIELMLQVARTLFREGLLDDARRFVEIVTEQVPGNVEATALRGYIHHRLGDDRSAIACLRHALEIDPEYSEGRIYLGNILYDQADYEAALHHLDRTVPEDHWDELAIWRLVELKKSLYRLPDGDPELKPWDERLAELTETADDVDELLAEIEQRFNEEAQEGPRNQLELFGALLSDLVEQNRHDDSAPAVGVRHRVQVGGTTFDGTWAEIVRKMRDSDGAHAGLSVEDYMASEARRAYRRSGVRIPYDDPERFLRGSADAGLLRIVR